MNNNVTIYTLAEELKMTPSTVSRAFNPEANISEKKRRMVLETAKKYNFIPNKMASRLSMQKMRIGVLLYYRFKPCYSELIRGIDAAHEELKDYKITCDLQFLDKNEHSVEECRAILKRFVEYDGIIIGGLNYDTNRSIISEIYAENKNLVLLHTYSYGSEKLFASAVDVETAAKLAAELLKDTLMFSNRKNVALFCGEMSTGIHRKSQQAFLKMAEEYGLNVCGVYEMQDKSEVLRDICKNELSKIVSQIDGIYITSGNSIELCKYIEENNLQDKIALVTFDTYPEINEFLKKNIINATIYQNLFGQAKNAYENLFYYLSENRQIPEVISTKCELVLKQNLFFYD